MLGDATALGERCGECPKPHRAAEIAARRALLQLVAAHPLRHHADHRLAGLAELRRARILDAGQIARGLDARHLHAEADAEIRHPPLPRELRRTDLAFRTALAEAAGHQNPVHAFEQRRWILALEDLALDPLQPNLDVVGDAGMDQRLVERLVGVLVLGVLADDGDRDLALGRC